MKFDEYCYSFDTTTQAFLDHLTLKVWGSEKFIFRDDSLDRMNLGIFDFLLVFPIFFFFYEMNSKLV